MGFVRLHTGILQQAGGDVELTGTPIFYVSTSAPTTNAGYYWIQYQDVPYPDWEKYENGGLAASYLDTNDIGNVSWAAASTNREIHILPEGGLLANINGNISLWSGYVTQVNDDFRKLPNLEFLAINGEHRFEGELGDWSKALLLEDLQFDGTGGAIGFGFETADLFVPGPSMAAIDLRNHRINAAGVNRILAKCDEGGLIGGSIQLNGGTNAAPDNASGGFDGLAAKASLQSKLWSISHN